MVQGLAEIFIIFTIITGSNNINIPYELGELITPKTVLQQNNWKITEKELIAKLIPQKITKTKFSQKQIQQAVTNLGDQNFRVRKAAKQQLIQAGKPAIPALKKASNSPDPEVSENAKQLLTTITETIQTQQKKKKTTTKQLLVLKLMAIKQLAIIKSQKSLPVLKQIANNNDQTLADAAKTAIANINNKPKHPIDGYKQLQSIENLIPQNVAFVILTDFTHNRKPTTCKQYVQQLTKIAKEKLKNRTGQQAIKMLSTLPAQITPRICTTLGIIGNIRIDAIAITISKNFTIDKEHSIISIIFKGFYDKEKIIANLEGFEKRIVHGQIVYAHPKGNILPQFCFLNPSTMIIAFNPIIDFNPFTPNNPNIITPTLISLNTKNPSKLFKETLQFHKKQKCFMVAKGAFSKKQKQIMLASIGKEINRTIQQRETDKEIMLTSMKFAQALIHNNDITAQTSKDNTITIKLNMENTKNAKIANEQGKKIIEFLCKKLTETPILPLNFTMEKNSINTKDKQLIIKIDPTLFLRFIGLSHNRRVRVMHRRPVRAMPR